MGGKSKQPWRLFMGKTIVTDFFEDISRNWHKAAGFYSLTPLGYSGWSDTGWSQKISNIKVSQQCFGVLSLNPATMFLFFYLPRSDSHYSSMSLEGISVHSQHWSFIFPCLPYIRTSFLGKLTENSGGELRNCSQLAFPPLKIRYKISTILSKWVKVFFPPFANARQIPFSAMFGTGKVAFKRVLTM